MTKQEAHGIGAKWAIKRALADALRRAADDLEGRDLQDGERGYNARIEWPKLYTVQPEEGPAALRAVADQITQPENSDARAQERQRVREALREQAAEYRREANEAGRCGEPAGKEKLLVAADVVDCLTRIISEPGAALDTLEDSDG
jgi:hypothetical protein